MGDPTTFWLMATNLALAAVVVACLAAALFAVVSHLIDRARKRARIACEFERYLRRTLEAERLSARSPGNPDRVSIPSPAV